MSRWSCCCLPWIMSLPQLVFAGAIGGGGSSRCASFFAYGLCLAASGCGRPARGLSNMPVTTSAAARNAPRICARGFHRRRPATAQRSASSTPGPLGRAGGGAVRTRRIGQIASGERLGGARRRARSSRPRARRTGALAPALGTGGRECRQRAATAPRARAALFALLERGQPLLLTGREAPAAWPARLPDLASRFRALLAFRAMGAGRRAARGPGEKALRRPPVELCRTRW